MVGMAKKIGSLDRLQNKYQKYTQLLSVRFDRS